MGIDKQYIMSDALDKDLSKKYEQGFVTEVEAFTLPPGLNEDVIAKISQFKKEPQWLLDWRLKAYRHWLTMEPPGVCFDVEIMSC